jgi:Glycosyl Hydrolase Family 88.
LKTKEEKFLIRAEDFLSKLKNRFPSKTVFKSFLFYYGASIGEILYQNEKAKGIGLRGAESLIEMYNEESQVIPLGLEAEESHSVGESEVNVDSVIATPFLSWAYYKSGNTRMLKVSLNHALRLSELINQEGRVIQSASLRGCRVLRKYTHKGYSDQSTWARGQAWAMINYTLSYYWVKDIYFLELARLTSNWWIRNLPSDYVSFWDFDDPKIPNTKKDTSATAIAANSLLKLHEMTNNDLYREVAQKSVEALINNYLTPLSQGDARPKGMLINGCYNMRINLATEAELIWGDYFLFETLLRLNGDLKAMF